MAPKASDDLHAYNSWRRALIALPVGTVVRWIDPKPYVGATMSSNIHRGECFLIQNLRDSIRPIDGYDASKAYDMVQCSGKKFKPFKRTFSPYVESVARWLEEGQLEILRAV